MPTEALIPEIRRGGEVAERRFDPRSAAPFVYKSTSEEMRRAYRRTLLEFFRFNGMKHQADAAPAEVLRWRDTLRSQRKSAATRLVLPPEVSSQPAGRALTVKEVRYILAGPGREKPKGARD